MYLFYDIRGIQDFIFGVPKLKCIVGASSHIATFDYDASKWIEPGECIFAGGGKGAFDVADDKIDGLCKRLVDRAHSLACDIEIGIDKDLSTAMFHPQYLYPFCPNDLEGPPCAASGLLPVGKKSTASGVNPIIQERLTAIKREDGLKLLVLPEIENRVRKRTKLPADYNLDFFKTVTVDEEDQDDPDAALEAKAARFALGGRNRWSVIAMDGNDIGSQSREFLSKNGSNGLAAWMKEMSAALDVITRTAFVEALVGVSCDWITELQKSNSLDRATTPRSDSGGKTLILPFRPLILGGDDVALLCHCSYAHRFVQRMSSHFANLSKAADNAEYLWPATNGKLTMSAGVLYVKVTYPLHSAIAYAESLLKSAKGAYRNTDNSSGEPTPAAIDWDTVTDTLVDTPAERRFRELVFVDKDLGEDVEVRLTQRPYLLDDADQNDGPRFADLLGLVERMRGLTNSTRARILPNLRKPWAERFEYLASIAKHNPTLRELLDEEASTGSSWRPVTRDGNIVGRMTAVPDALMLLEEEHRFDNPTADGEA